MKKHTIYKSQQGMENIHNYYETYLNLFPIEFERVYVTTRFGKTHTLVTGPANGKPIFIFQGGNSINPVSLSWFTNLFKEYRIYAPDTIGHPGYSEETRISAKDASFALWITDLMDYFQVEKSAFIGPSYGAGIILRLATFIPQKISCAILIVPAGLAINSILNLSQKIGIPFLGFKFTKSQKFISKIIENMSTNQIEDLDKKIISEVFKSVKLEKSMPKKSDRIELLNYSSPTLILAGRNDIFFPATRVVKTAKTVIPHAITKTYDIAHLPSQEQLLQINVDIKDFLNEYY